MNSPLIIVAPDSFKGSATAAEAAAGIASGIRAELADATVVTLPMADGGEGTAQVLAEAAAARGEHMVTVQLPATDAVGRLTEATYFLNQSTQTAYIDVAAATGLPAVKDALEPRTADSYGTGVLIADAESRGAKHIVLGLGGSATIDGGTGILTALGAAAHDARGYALSKGGAALVQLDTIDTAQLNMKAAMLDYTLLADTRTVPAHAPAVFGPQKGATREDVALLTGAMLRLCEVTGTDADRESFGAAGCIPVGLTWVSALLWGSEDHTTLEPGGRFVAEALGIPERLREAALLVTGEGRFDEQSTTGKVVGTLLDLAEDSATPAAVVAGELASNVPEGVLSAELSQKGELQEQLREAGRAIARSFSSRG